jgi:hypothetical protein
MTARPGTIVALSLAMALMTQDAPPSFLAEAVQAALEANGTAATTAAPDAPATSPDLTAAEKERAKGVLGSLWDLLVHIWKGIASLFSAFIKIRFFYDAE